MSEISSEQSEMPASLEASELIKELASPAPAGAHIETLIRGVARKVGLSYSRAKSIWYQEARLIRAEEMDALRKASRKQAGLEIERFQREREELRQRIERLEAIVMGEGSRLGQ